MGTFNLRKYAWFFKNSYGKKDLGVCAKSYFRASLEAPGHPNLSNIMRKPVNFGLIFVLLPFNTFLGHFRHDQLPSWASFIGSLPVLSAHSFASNSQLLFLNQRKRENGRRIFLRQSLHKRMSPRKNVPDVGVELGATCISSGHISDRAIAPSENLLMSYADNKGADRPVHPHSLISTFVIRCPDGTTPSDGDKNAYYICMPIFGPVRMPVLGWCVPCTHRKMTVHINFAM